jgi:polyisoprenoid-binding protein YceI
MTRPASSPGRPGGVRRSTWPRIAAGLLAVAVVGAAAYGGWYLFLRPAGPPPVDLAALPPAATAEGAPAGMSSSAPATNAATGAAAPAATEQGAASSAATTTATGGLDGTWTVDTSIGSETTGSFVGYRVQETLAGIGANTAVGRTSSVTGSFTLQGSKITAATITADLTGLQSDDNRRDGQLSHRGLETSTFPTATFTLSQPVDLGSIPADGQIVSVTATGQLTLHGQTKTVEIPLQARLSGGIIAVTGTLPIAFADYGISPPTSFIALSVEDHGTMELQLMFTKG